MPDIDFLPAWYAQLGVRQRVLRRYALLGVAVVGYVAWCCNTSRLHVSRAASRYEQVNAALNADTARALDPEQSATQVSQLLAAAQKLATIRGLPPLSNHLTSITEAIPPGICILELAIDPPARPALTTQPGTDGLQVRLRARAPRVADVANCQAGLERLSCLQDVRLLSARELAGPGPFTREFEMSFMLCPTGARK